MIKKIVVLTSLIFIVTSCGVNPDRAKNILETQGVKNPVIEGYSWFGCAKEDYFRSNWTGENQEGKPISGVICGGLLKGYTVRFD